MLFIYYFPQAGEEHYNTISALHKAMRGGDANAALYWLGRMLEAGDVGRRGREQREVGIIVVVYFKVLLFFKL